MTEWLTISQLSEKYGYNKHYLRKLCRERKIVSKRGERGEFLIDSASIGAKKVQTRRYHTLDVEKLQNALKTAKTDQDRQELQVAIKIAKKYHTTR